MFFFWSLWGWFDSFIRYKNTFYTYLAQIEFLARIRFESTENVCIFPKFYTMIQIIIIVSGRINFFQKLANVIRIFCVQQFINSFNSIVK